MISRCREICWLISEWWISIYGCSFKTSGRSLWPNLNLHVTEKHTFKMTILKGTCEIVALHIAKVVRHGDEIMCERPVKARSSCVC